MTEQWQELKETIIEMRDNDGIGTQQEVCKFLANLMDVLEKQMNDGWIPVSERLPEELKTVIVTDIETSETYPSQYFGNGVWECDNGYFRNRIVAWMPLPEPYKAESEEK